MENGNIKSRSGMSLTVRQAVNSFIGRARPDIRKKEAEALNKDTFWATRRVGFTLVELLVVVLIIGVLSAIAIPMYQGAVDKSHWSTMLPGAKALKDAEEAIKMTNGAYTDNMANLDVTMNNADLTFALVTPNNTADPNVIRVTNSKLDNVRLASYLDDNPKFAGQLHCEAKTGDERAERLCEKLLMGQELTSIDGYVGYLLDQKITKDICGEANRSWSTSKMKCYKTTADRCEALGMPVIEGEDKCGHRDGMYRTYGPEGVCIGNQYAYGCFINYFQGGICEGQGNSTCNGGYFIDNSICRADAYGSCCQTSFASGSVCEANVAGTCNRLTIKDGGICRANAPGTCADTVTYDGGCCEGPYCPSNAPKC